MDDIQLVDPTEVPKPRRVTSEQVRLAEETLRKAMQLNKSVRVAPAPDQRANSVVSAYKAAARRIGVGVLVTKAGQQRTYINVKGTQSKEMSILYFSLTRKPAATNGTVRSPISPSESQRVFAHGVEVSRW